MRRASLNRSALLASFLFLFVFHASAQPVASYDTVVFVEFRNAASNQLWPTLQSALGHSETPKLLGNSVRWMKREEFRKGMEFKQIYQIVLEGDCGMASPNNGQNVSTGPLGWVFMDNGEILPFVFVDCDRIAQILHRDLRGKTISARRRILARAISRVVVHEVSHIVTQSPLHDSRGLRKAYLASFDLLKAGPD